MGGRKTVVVRNEIDYGALKRSSEAQMRQMQEYQREMFDRQSKAHNAEIERLTALSNKMFEDTKAHAYQNSISYNNMLTAIQAQNEASERSIRISQENLKNMGIESDKRREEGQITLQRMAESQRIDMEKRREDLQASMKVTEEQKSAILKSLDTHLNAIREYNANADAIREMDKAAYSGAMDRINEERMKFIAEKEAYHQERMKSIDKEKSELAEHYARMGGQSKPQVDPRIRSDQLEYVYMMNENSANANANTAYAKFILSGHANDNLKFLRRGDYKKNRRPSFTGPHSGAIQASHLRGQE